MRASWLLGIFFLFVSQVCFALPRDTPLTDPLLEARAQTLFQSLRCVVCQTQSIADSDAALAVDMRAKIRQQLRANESDETIRNALVNQYGAQILIDPALSFANSFLWLAPFLLLLAGSLLALRYLRKA